MYTYLDKLIKGLRGSKFDFQSQERLFNPLEEFVDRVRENENTHSKIIEDLLNPKGTHNQGHIFLESFLLEILEQYNYETTSLLDFNYEDDFFIKREFCIKEYSPDKNDAGRIDIYIELKNKAGTYFGIIIENKINNAPFQSNQLERYRDAIKEKFNRENRKDSKILSVCIPKLCSTKLENPCAIILPDKLGDIFESATKFCYNTHVSNMMTSYITCLRNINIINVNMNNSEKLFEFLKSNQSEIKISDVKAISEAYSTLPELYLNLLRKSIDKRISADSSASSDIRHKFDSTYREYLNIWDERIYRHKKTWQWLSVKADHNFMYLYLVSNDDDDKSRDEKAELLDYGLRQTYAGGKTWYKPIDSSGKVDLDRFQINFENGLPDIESITDRIFKILEKMKDVAE